VSEVIAVSTQISDWFIMQLLAIGISESDRSSRNFIAV
jgi:hypothetical protein